MTTAITFALTYIRVSGREQEREGLSLPAQLADCRRYIQARDWVIGTEYRDVMKGTRSDRPQYQAMLAELRRRRADGQQCVVVVKWMHRLGRDILESIRCRRELRSLDVAVHSVLEGGEVSDFIANIMAAQAQYEVEQLGERVASTWAHTTSLGWWKTGRTAWGFLLRDATDAERREGAPRKVPDIDPDVAPYVVEAFQRLADGSSGRDVCRWVAALPDHVRGGRPLGTFAVQRIFRAPIYVGRPTTAAVDVWGKGRPLKKRPVDWEVQVLARPRGRWPALVSDEVWWDARRRLIGHQRMPRQASGQHLLSGIARCPDCGSRMYGVLARGEAARYRCGGWLADGDHTSHCFRTAKRDQVDQVVLDEVTVLLAPLAEPRPRRALQKAWDELRRSEPNVDRARQRKRLSDATSHLRQRLARATTKFVDDQIPRSEYDALVKRTEADLGAIEAELGALDAAEPLPLLPPFDEAVAALGGFTAAVKAMDTRAQRDVLAALIDRVTPHRVGFGMYTAEVTWTTLGEALRRLNAALDSAA